MSGEIRLKEYDTDSAQNNFAAKWYLNGFPKSGLHLAVSMIEAAVKVMPAGQLHAKPWVGTFKHHSWSDEWQDLRAQMYLLSRVAPGHYFKGHCAHTRDIEAFIRLAGINHVFVYRDMRDVAVSQTHHILSEEEKFKHPAKDLYREMGDFDAALLAVIEGVDKYPGVMQRWEHYHKWLFCGDVFLFRYENAIADLEGTARGLLYSGLRRIESIFHVKLRPDKPSFEHAVETMARRAADPSKSLTYRKGKAGGWCDAFKGVHVDAFKRSDVKRRLIEAGYKWE